MAASALVATADGEVSFSERSAVDSILASVEALQVFDVHDAVDIFSDDYQGTAAFGDEGLFAYLAQKVRQVSTDPYEASRTVKSFFTFAKYLFDPRGGTREANATK